MIISQLLEERNITARGLAHPVIFQGSSGGGGGGFDQRTPDEPVIRDKDGRLPEMGTFQKVCVFILIALNVPQAEFLQILLWLPWDVQTTS